MTSRNSIATAFAAIVFAALSGCSETSPLEEARYNASSDLAAVESAIAFPVPLSGDTGGIVFFDRTTQTAKVIVEPGVFLGSPHFSSDGKRLLLVSGATGKDQLLSCEVLTWRCATLWEMNGVIRSPIFINGDMILFSSAPALEQNTKYPAYRYDFYLIDRSQQLHQLSEKRYFQLTSLSVSGSTLVFMADDIGGWRSTRARSYVYSVSIDIAARKIDFTEFPLTALFSSEGGSSAFPAISTDGSLVAFVDLRGVPTMKKRNLVVVSPKGDVLKYIEAEGSFSEPQITKTEIIANELLKDGYKVQVFARDGFKQRTLFELKFKPDEIQKLEKLKLEILPQ